MSMLITDLATVRKNASPEGLKLFYAEHELTPESPEPEHGVCIDHMDLLRYGMKEDAHDLHNSTQAFIAESLAPTPALNTGLAALGYYDSIPDGCPKSSLAIELAAKELKGPVRPTTRGELATRLKNGETCEVASHVAEMTALMLQGWLNVDDFTVTPSTNPGWSIFAPKIKTI